MHRDQDSSTPASAAGPRATDAEIETAALPTIDSAAPGDEDAELDPQERLVDLQRKLSARDRTIEVLIKRLESAEIVRSAGRDTDQVFFGASVRIKQGSEIKQITIVGVDEAEPARGQVSWISPIARALIKAREGDTVTLRSPSGEEQLEILEVTYP